ncbi:MAG TPA: 2-amino-4-hydroxy-6-hydroxymethyldihydropteridine diphosphokinase [Burkholderiaceae bacterium]|nr:2-amino-4-hydroxy-6-hydroxymethyldihydropteridine diphosphokinase [Burkholderiaceae bacterium]
MSGAPTVAYVGVGANMDEPREQVERGIDALGTLPETHLVARSGLYASAPVDAPGPDYVNAVVELRTTLGAGALLEELHRIEARFGRQRSTRNAPRVLDLDLLLYGELRSDAASLRLPHPRLHLRAFVLLPLLEVAPDLEVNGLGPLSACLDRVRDQPVHRLDSGANPAR